MAKKLQIEVKEKGLLELISMVKESEILLLKLIVKHFQNTEVLTKDKFTELIGIAHQKMVEYRKASLASSTTLKRGVSAKQEL